jgi:2-C-methyl-D-erythritol 4-phosphate cytidylyltransferase
MLAAGEGSRVGHDTNKVLLPLAGRRVFTWAIRWATHLPHVTHLVLVIRDQDRDTIDATLDREVEDPRVMVVRGGDSRHGSEWAALQALRPAIEGGELDVVVIHDAARPLAGTALFQRVIAEAADHGGAVPAVSQQSLIGLEHGTGAPTSGVVSVQTPQAFVAQPLLAAYAAAAEDGFVGTDTAACMEHYHDLPVRWVEGDPRNIKITFPEDLFLAERLLAKADFDLSQHDRSRAEPESPRRGHLWERLHRGEHR